MSTQVKSGQEAVNEVNRSAAVRLSCKNGRALAETEPAAARVRF